MLAESFYGGTDHDKACFCCCKFFIFEFHLSSPNKQKTIAINVKRKHLAKLSLIKRQYIDRFTLYVLISWSIFSTAFFTKSNEETDEKNSTICSIGAFSRSIVMLMSHFRCRQSSSSWTDVILRQLLLLPLCTRYVYACL